ncbi:diguanylate cyclase [Petroclostridium sp. X23]|nr:diguanylate cyclase [Petroclostridium sp. X23]WHH61683.1 diguanylate cyclase [Petroclostridium sp. X23]
MEVAERVRTTIEKHVFILRSGQQLKITLSIGVSSYPDTTLDLSNLKEQADAALYNAKLKGRNKVVLANFYEERPKLLTRNA